MTRSFLRPRSACKARDNLTGQSPAARSATRDLWTIGIYTGPSPLHLSQAAGAANPVLTGADITDMPDLAIDTVAHPSLVVDGARHYMFFTAKDLRKNKGGIGLAESTGHAPDLSGRWTEHPASPLVNKDPNIARPAGRPFRFDGALHRLAQDCAPTYGLQVYAFRITTLSPSAYAEEQVPTPLVSASGQGWNAKAMHHVDAVERSPGRWIAAVDALGH